MPFSFRSLFLLLFASLLLAACNAPTEGSTQDVTRTAAPSSTTAQPASDLTIKEVVFTHKLAEDMTPTDVAASFSPEQEIYLSVRLDGNPKEGLVSAVFFYNDQQIADAQVDLARARDDQGVIFVIGGDTYVGFTLSHESPFPPSKHYRAAIALDGLPAGEYGFQVSPPDDAIPSKLLSATLAQDVVAESYDPYKPSNVFPADKPVFLAGRVDLGRLSSLTARWYIDGELDDNATRTLSSSENAKDTPFYFTYQPENNWPEGEHKVILLINDEPVGEYEFTIKPTE